MPKTEYKNVLVIEDNLGDFVLIEDYLKEELNDIFVTNAKTFAQSKELISTQLFSVIFLDLSLPDAEGEPLVKEIILLAKTVPVIVLTGFSNKEFGIRTLSLGVSDYLLKDELNAMQLYKSLVYSIERKKIQTQIQISEAKYRNLFQLSPLPMWVYDLDTLYFLSINDAAIKYYGYTEKEFLGMTIKDIRPIEDVPALELVIDETRQKNAHYTGSWRHLRKNGQIINVEIQSKSIEFDGRKARLILAIDVSERYQYINTIESQNSKLRAIAWTQSHTVRAPLAKIMGLAHVLSSDSAASKQQQELLGHLLASANELDAIIRDIVYKTEQVD